LGFIKNLAQQKQRVVKGLERLVLLLLGEPIRSFARKCRPVPAACHVRPTVNIGARTRGEAGAPPQKILKARLSAQLGIDETSSEALNEMDAELNSENSSGLGETHGQSEVCESSATRPQRSEAAIGADAALREGSLAAGARYEGQAKAGIAQLAQPSVEAEKNAPAAKTGGSSAGASFAGAAVDPLKEASAALEDRDYATAQRLFAAIGRNDVADAIRDALAALDARDYAKAHGLFEALGQKGAAAAPAKGPAPVNPSPPKPAMSAGGPVASDSRDKPRQRSATSPLDVVPPVDAAYRRPLPQAERPKSRRFKPLLAGTGLAIVAILGVSAIYGSPLSWTFPTTRSAAVAGLSSAAGVLKADLKAITGQSAREQELSATRDLNTALTQLTGRLDRIEQTYGARLDKLSARVDQDSSPRFADIAARLDRLEKKAASPAPPASESAEVVARLDRLERRVAVAAASASEIAGLTTRLNKLERRAAVAGAISAGPLPPAGPRQASVMARAEPSAPNEAGRSEDGGPLLRDYSVEFVREGVAVIDTRSGPQEVAPGDSVPGAGRVLRIERRGGVWFVVTSRGVIGSGPAP